MTEAIGLSTHNIGFYEDLTKIIFELSSNIIKYAPYYAPNFEKVDGAYCFWSVLAWVGHTFCTHCNF